MGQVIEFAVFVLIPLALLMLGGLIAFAHALRQSAEPIEQDTSEPSPPASVTGHHDLPDRTAQSPPVADDGGETG